MIEKRLIPCLLIHKNGLYKTVKFKKPTYIGDPINAIRIFNDKEVDEIMVLDIDASVKKEKPNFKLIEELASECFMPLCYGGGVKSIDDMKRIYYLGVEKISLSSIVIENPELVTDAVSIFGSQSVIVTMDIKKNIFGKYQVHTYNGKKNTKRDPVEYAQYLEKLGVGELVINTIDKDGMMNGYDLQLIQIIKDVTNIPLIALGGAGSLTDIKIMLNTSNISAAGAGSLFVFQGPLKGVLINYPKDFRL